MEVGPATSRYTFRWTKHSDFVYRPSREATIVLLGFAVAMCALSMAMSMPIMAFSALSMAWLPIATWIPLRTKLVRRDDHVDVYRQPLHRNGVLQITVMMAMMCGGMIAAPFAGYGGAGRMFVPAVMGVALVPVLLVVSYRDRGPLTLWQGGVEFGNGDGFEFGLTTVNVVVLRNGVPAIEFTTTGSSRRPRRLMHRPYNIDFNTLASTIQQLQRWHAQGRHTSPAEIEAMLTVRPPDVHVGETVQLVIPITARP